MGEAKRRQLAVQTQALEAMAVDTPGGRIHVQWDHAASATPNAQLTFFAEFLATTCVYDAWVNSCPLSYTSPNAHSKRDVLGTWLLAILAGHKPYAHITGLRGDAVSPQILGMNKLISEDALRRSLARMESEQSKAWLVPQLHNSVQAALSTLWILDIDTTIKPLFGKQSGAEVSYNPHKPGRPSHAPHTYWVGNLRLVLDVVVSPGKEHSAAKARPGLMDVLNKLSQAQRPALVRGDCGFGNEPFIAELEERSQPYLFKLRQNAGVKKLLTRQFAREDWSSPGPSDQGWSAVEDTLQLSGWDKSRRVVILRRAVRADLALSRKTSNQAGEQIELLMPDKDVQAWEYAVLVTNSTYALDTYAAGVWRAVKHAGQTTLYLTQMHAAKDKLLGLIANIRAALSHVRAVAEQLPQADRWKTFLDYVVAKMTRPLPPWRRPDQLMMPG